MPDASHSHLVETGLLVGFRDHMREQEEAIQKNKASLEAGLAEIQAVTTAIDARLAEIRRLMQEELDQNPELPFADPPSPGVDPQTVVTEDDGEL